MSFQQQCSRRVLHAATSAVGRREFHDGVQAPASERETVRDVMDCGFWNRHLVDVLPALGSRQCRIAWHNYMLCRAQVMNEEILPACERLRWEEGQYM